MLFRSILLLLLSAHCAAWTKIPVITSSYPLANLSQGIVGDLGTVHPLIPSRASIHDYHLKPSDIRALTQAKVFIWFGAAIEPRLVPLVKKLPQSVHVIDLSKMPQLILYPSRDSQNLALATPDPHVWLAIDNAILISRDIGRHLARLDKMHRDHYTRNTKQQIADLTRLKHALSQQLKPVHDMHYIVFHTAYQYFEKNFNLMPPLVIGHNIAHEVSIRQLASVQQQIAKQPVACIFVDQRSTHPILDRLHEQTGLARIPIEPIGTGRDVAYSHYTDVLNAIATAFLRCHDHRPI